MAVENERPSPFKHRDGPSCICMWQVMKARKVHAISPDEAALVAAARDVGFPFVDDRAKDAVDIEVMGQPERYIPLQLLEFNSTRKRMSVIVRNPQGQIVLYCKGADSVIYQRSTTSPDVGLVLQ
ncbi:hypothetical protein C8Q73DRAFT_832053 [Cubamyces lactineus]|nr:hypothetical protein C8Q73DRAFT_832053 [Cubamyces lactineus]